MIIASTYWTHNDDGSKDLRFVDEITGAEEIRHYKTAAAAKRAETMFHRRIGRTYGGTTWTAASEGRPGR